MTRKQREAELRDAAARSRREYQDEKRARRLRLKLAPTPAADPFLLAGDVAEYVTAIEAFAADADDADLLRAVAALRSQTTRVGDLLARRRETYKENQRPGSLHSDGDARAGARGGQSR